MAAGWKLDQVTVEVPSRGEKHIFPCNRWLDATEDDKKIERELVPGTPGSVNTTLTKTGPPTPSRTVSKTVVEKTSTSFRQVPKETNKYGTTPKPAGHTQINEKTRFDAIPV